MKIVISTSEKQERALEELADKGEVFSEATFSLCNTVCCKGMECVDCPLDGIDIVKIAKTEDDDE